MRLHYIVCRYDATVPRRRLAFIQCACGARQLPNRCLAAIYMFCMLWSARLQYRASRQTTPLRFQATLHPPLGPRPPQLLLGYPVTYDVGLALHETYVYDDLKVPRAISARTVPAGLALATVLGTRASASDGSLAPLYG